MMDDGGGKMDEEIKITIINLIITHSPSSFFHFTFYIYP